VSGSLVICLGLTVMMGWMTHQNSLVQIVPTYAPMQYNTAMCFVLSGLGLVLLMLSKRRLVTVIGMMVVAFGSLTLLQYLFDINLGIDELFWQHQITVKTSHQGVPVQVVKT